ncbi:MAG: hypothetical protein AAF829_00410 [Pseudomonadota bacterium]
MRRGSTNWAVRLALWWRGTGPNTRLALGIGAVVLLWWLGLGRIEVAGVLLPWPVGLLLAAMGWARVGLAMRPMLALVSLSILFDLGSNAPIGSYMIVALITYGVHAAAESALDLEHDPLMRSMLPFVSLFAGLMVLWVLASASTGQLARLSSLVFSGMATALAFGLLAPLFHLRIRPGARVGRA